MGAIGAFTAEPIGTIGESIDALTGGAITIATATATTISSDGAPPNSRVQDPRLRCAQQP